jgi:DNA-nicking Smr family endonuclease
MGRSSAVAARKPPADETALFRAAMHDVKPLSRRVVPLVPKREPLPPPATLSKAKSAPPRANGTAKPAAPPPNPGLDRRTADRVRKGEIPIDGRIDLHGMTQDNAHAALDRFVRQAWKDGQRMLLVITGKGNLGEGVLRRGVPRWLASGEHAARILKVSSAQPRHGGEGAFYVLLRRQRDRA